MGDLPKNDTTSLQDRGLYHYSTRVTLRSLDEFNKEGEPCMNERVGIVALAQTSYEPSHDRWRSHELTSVTVEKVLKETGLTWAKDRTGIDATVTCNNW